MKDWVRANITKEMETVKLYIDQFRELLHSKDNEELETRLADFRMTWNEKFTKYYDGTLKDVVFSSFRYKLEQLDVYHPMSGITNNAAESANAYFKRRIKMKTTSMYQLLSFWYFHQTDALLDICRGFKNQGKFCPFQPIPSNLSLPVNMKAIEDATVVDEMIRDGKFPETVSLNPKYKSVSLYETTTMRGLARCLVGHGCVKFLEDTKTFVVGGLVATDPTYLVLYFFNQTLPAKATPVIYYHFTLQVDLAKLSCTCLRNSTCTHLFAVQIYLGLERRLPLKRNQPNLGTLYQKTAKKYVGMKKGLGARSRLRLPKKCKLHTVYPDLFSSVVM